MKTRDIGCQKYYKGSFIRNLEGQVGGMGGKFFADMIASTAGEDFEMLKLKNSPNKADRQKYYELNPHL